GTGCAALKPASGEGTRPQQHRAGELTIAYPRPPYPPEPGGRTPGQRRPAGGGQPAGKGSGGWAVATVVGGAPGYTAGVTLGRLVEPAGRGERSWRRAGHVVVPGGQFVPVGHRACGLGGLSGPSRAPWPARGNLCPLGEPAGRARPVPTAPFTPPVGVGVRVPVEHLLGVPPQQPIGDISWLRTLVPRHWPPPTRFSAPH